MKKYVLLALCLVVFATTWALPVTKEQARSQARQYLLQRRLPGNGQIELSDVAKSTILKSKSTDAAPQLYYVFNVNGSDGFIIVSADDSTQPILGWCDHGSFDAANMPENMRALLESYEEELQWMSRAAAVGVPSVSSPAPVKDAVAPLLTTRWNQGSPFNLQCPYYLNNANNSHCVTGCVATSMAQVLAYQGLRPAGTTMTIPGYDCTTKWTADSIRIHVNEQPKTTFDWDKMVDVYDKNATSEQQQAVAKLMACCGAAIVADYGEKATSAYQNMVVPALRVYFNTDGHRIMRQDYTYTQWSNIIYGELEAGRPVIYDGKASDGGHSFVVDGFDGGDLFHVNWGWGGNNDGYFALSILHPNDNSGIGASLSDDGYSYGQSAIIGIKPGVTPIDEPIQLTSENITVDGNVVTFSIWNRTGETHTFDFGLGTVDEIGHISHVIEGITDKELDDRWGYSKFSITIDGNNLAPGVYRYVVASKESSSDTWLTVMQYWRKYIEATVDNSHTVTLRLMPLAPQLSLVGGLTCPSGSKYVGQTLSITAKVKNSGGEFCGPLYLFASQTYDKGEYESRLGMTIAAGETSEAVFSFTPSKEGTWNIWLCSDREGKDVLGSNMMVVNKVSYTKPGYLELTSLRIISPIDEDSWTTDGAGIKQVDVLSKSLQVTPVVRNTSSTDLMGENKVYLRLEQKDGSTWRSIKSYTYTIRDFRANTGYTLTMKGGNPIDFGEVGYGLYRIAIYLDSGVQDVRYQLNLTGGYYLWAADGKRTIIKTTAKSLTIGSDAVAADLRHIDFSSITANSNPNTLYIVSATQTAPASLKDKNVVQEGVAANITLTDGYSFFSPIDFTAQHISYSRTFTTPFTTESTGWNSFALPFNPQSVMADGRQIDWFRHEEEVGKDFFIMELSGDDEATAYFIYAEHLQPYRPYIVGVPGDDFGSASLVNKEITFSALNATVPTTQTGIRSGNVYKFHGTTAKTASMEHIYCINTAGNAFVSTSGSVHPFRSYFTAHDVSPNRINIRFARFKPSAIIAAPADAPATRQGIYTLSGVRIDDSQPLAPGIYIVNGKKKMVGRTAPGKNAMQME